MAGLVLLWRLVELIAVVCLTGFPCSAEVRVVEIRFLRGEWVAPPGELIEGAEADGLAVGDEFIVLAEVLNAGLADETVFNLVHCRFSPQDSVDELVSAEPCVGLFPIDLRPGECAVLTSSLVCAAAFRASKPGSVTMEVDVWGLSMNTIARQSFEFDIVIAEDGGDEGGADEDDSDGQVDEDGVDEEDGDGSGDVCDAMPGCGAGLCGPNCLGAISVSLLGLSGMKLNRHRKRRQNRSW